MPARTLSELSTAQLKTVLLHELVHIKRRDYLVNLLQSIVQAIWFFQPVVGWISTQTRIERECSCDDRVIEILKGNKLSYAQALSRLSNGCLSKLAINAREGQILSRLRRFNAPNKRISIAKLVSLSILGSTLSIMLLLSLAFPIRAITSQFIQFTTPNSEPSAFLLRQARKLGITTPVSVAPIQIQGALKSQPGNVHQPALVVLSSCDANKQILAKRVQQLSSWGYATLHISPCNVSDKTRGQAFDQHDLPIVAYGALNYLRQQQFIDADRIGILDWTDKGNAGLSVVNEDGVQQLFDYKFRTAVTATLNCRSFVPPYISSVMILSNGAHSAHDLNYCQRVPQNNADIDNHKIVIIPHKKNSGETDDKTMDAVQQFLASNLI